MVVDRLSVAQALMKLLKKLEGGSRVESAI
jgi:hypothetical protein